MDLAGWAEPTVDDLKLWLTAADYTRPGWTLTIYTDPHEGPKLRARADVPDAYHPDRTTPLGINARIPTPLIRSADDFYRWLLWRLMEVEAHETREYFHVHGKPYRDPHDPLEP